jgi:RNA 3'-terminal phosphate cyclase (ATP)
MIEIDGSFGEGGGQILRAAVSFAAFLGEDVKITNIRARRENPGIRPQHKMAIRAVAEISGATVEGNEVGSSQIVFMPGTAKGGRFYFDIGTAGSITLVLQCVIPVAFVASSPTEVSIKGGTDVSGSPTSDYFENVFVKAVNWLGGNVSYQLKRRGYYPRGQGVVEVRVEPVRHLKGATLLERRGVRVRGRSHCSRLPAHVARRQAMSAKEMLLRKGIQDVEIAESTDDDSLDPGSSVALWLEEEGVFLGSDSLGARGKKAEFVGSEAAEKLISELSTGAPLDAHMGDMILPYLFLSTEKSEVRISRVTMHLFTEVYVAKKFPGIRVELVGDVEQAGLLRTLPLKKLI